MLIVNVHRRCFSVDFWLKMKVGLTFIDVVSKLTKQRWNNVDRIMSTQRRWTNLVSTLKFGWNWKLTQRMFIDVASTLTKESWRSIERITSVFQCWYLVENESWVNICSLELLRRWKNSIETNLSIYWCSYCWTDAH